MGAGGRRGGRRPGALLRKRAPRWRQVGRVCFHLAENRNDQERPFAFLATYASGFGAGGRLKHLPLRNALQQYAGANNRAALINLLAPGGAGGQGVRMGARAGGLPRPVSSAGVAARACLPVPAERAGAGAERVVRTGAQLVAQAVAAAGVGHDRHPGAGAGRRRCGAGLQGGGRARRQRAFGRRAGGAAQRL